MLSCLLHSLLAGSHLLGKETVQPGILGNGVLDEGNGQLTGDLLRGLTLLPTIEPGFRPTPPTFRVKEDGDLTLYIITVNTDSQVLQGIDDAASCGNFLSKFFFCASSHEGTYI